MTALLANNCVCLEQALALLEDLDSELYQWRCPGCFGSSIGGHLRHNADHYEQFLAGYGTGVIDYDRRERDRRIEEEPAAAADCFRRQVARLREVSAEDLDRAVSVRMDGEGETLAASSVRRELQFLLSHTIHHYALIVAIASAKGFRAFPEDFGVAPSILKHRVALATQG